MNVDEKINPYEPPKTTTEIPSYDALWKASMTGSDLSYAVNACVDICPSLLEPKSESMKPVFHILPQVNGSQRKKNSEIAHFVTGGKYAPFKNAINVYCCAGLGLLPNIITHPSPPVLGDVVLAALVSATSVVLTAYSLRDIKTMNKRSHDYLEHGKEIVQKHYNSLKKGKTFD